MSTDPINTQLLQLVTQQQSQIAAMQQQLQRTHEEVTRANTQVSEMSWMVSVLMQHHQTQVAEQEKRAKEQQQQQERATAEAASAPPPPPPPPVAGAGATALQDAAGALRNHFADLLGGRPVAQAEPQPSRRVSAQAMLSRTDALAGPVNERQRQRTARQMQFAFEGPLRSEGEDTIVAPRDRVGAVAWAQRDALAEALVRRRAEAEAIERELERQTSEEY